MRILSEEGARRADEVAARHGVGRDVVVTLLHALERGDGVQAQFSHPELGGLGQWSRGGMLMIGDMFNNALKARVDALCTELSELTRTSAMFKPVPRGEGPAPHSPSFASAWWPEDCGRPRASGGQNDMRYACFPDTHRLAVEQGGIVRLYDTGDHRITGVSQQQSGTQDLTFTSQHGTVRLHELSPVSEAASPDARTHEARPEPVRRQTTSSATPPPPVPSGEAKTPLQSRGFADHDVFAKIERLHELALRGVISDEEFAEKKKELLARI